MINSFVDTNSMTIKFSPAVEEKAFKSLQAAKERIEFDYMIKAIALEESRAKQESKKQESTKTEESKAETAKAEEIKNEK